MLEYVLHGNSCRCLRIHPYYLTLTFRESRNKENTRSINYCLQRVVSCAVCTDTRTDQTPDNQLVM